LKRLTLPVLIAFAAILLYGVSVLPNRGDPTSPSNRPTSEAGSPNAAAYYIEQAYRDAHTPNMVTVVLADYRGFDTLGETIVVFTAGLACYLILRRRPRSEPPA
jgi:multicomponent Na+:H+ antiporter subunit B